jgi:hypothetical protein
MANPNQMAPIVRGSTKETLLDLYQSVRTTQPMALFRDNLTGFTLQTMAWGLSKTAGTRNGFTDQINGKLPGGARDSAQVGFTLRQPVQTTSFTPGGLDYARSLGHGNQKYRG